VQVLAPDFAPTEFKVNVPSELVLVKLQVATASENVVVTATATSVPASETGVADYSIDGKQIQLINPVSASELLRYLPGAYVADNGRMGGLATLFVRGGETRYNKVIVDGVPVTVNDAGGVFNFGVVPMDQLSHVELQRGANSTLYGSDAMTSVVQMWSASGTSQVPELKFGADGGSFDTANGYASLSGARGRFDYNLFGDEFHTNGQGINDEYGNAMQGGNLGVKLSDKVSLRTRLRHSNSRTGTPGAWDFGAVTFPPDSDQYTRENDLLGSTVLSVAFSNTFQTTFTGFEYMHQRRNVDTFDDGRPYDEPFDSRGKFNNAGFEAQSEYTARAWARTVFGYRFEDESGSLTDNYTSFGIPGSSEARGLRRNHAVYGEQLISWQRLSVVAGVRYEHNEVFGGKVSPRVSASYLVNRGYGVFTGTRLRGAYAEGFKAPTFDQQFGEAGSYPILPNPNLKPEQTRSWEVGFTQDIANGKYSLAGTYFHNDFTNLINYITADPVTFVGQYVNLNKSLAHGAEFEINARLAQKLTVTGSYVYTSSQALIAGSCDSSGCTGPGQELFRRPKQLGQALVTWVSPRWGASVTGSFVGRRRDSDFYMLPSPGVSSVAGYARVDASAWRALNRYVTAYAGVYNLLNNHYQETVGYPALHVNFRAGFRFRVGGE
jgi:outer membrane cobalamin receptor